MKKFTWFLITVVSLLAAISVDAQAASRVKRGEYLISRSARTGPARLAKIPIEKWRSRTLVSLSSGREIVHISSADVISSPAGEVLENVIPFDKGAADKGCAEILQLDPAYEYCEPNYVYEKAAVPSDPQYGSLWAMPKIHAPEAWDTTTGSESVVIAVIDSGVDYTHPDLAANMWVNPGEIPGNNIDDDANGYVDDVHGVNTIRGTGDPMDNENHGTHVAGTIAAVGENGVGVIGVSWKSKIMAVKFLDKEGGGETAGAVQAISYAIRHGAAIINTSWGGGPYSRALEDAIRESEAAGVLFVAAAGNLSANNDYFPFYPADYDIPNIISVGATDINDNLAFFSNYGMAVDVAAPGDGILSTIRGGYEVLSGTSMAAPHVAGLAALLKAHTPAADYAYLKDRIVNYGDSLPTLSGLVASGRRVNAQQTLVGTVPPPPITKSDAPGSFELKIFGSTDHKRSTRGIIVPGEYFDIEVAGEEGRQVALMLMVANRKQVAAPCALPPIIIQNGRGTFSSEINLRGSIKKFARSVEIRASDVTGVQTKRARIRGAKARGGGAKGLAIGKLDRDMNRTCAGILRRGFVFNP